MNLRRPRQHSDATKANFECILFDMDDTLYPSSSGLMTSCSNLIQEYIMKRLQLDAKSSQELSEHLYKRYGSTLAGLVAIGYKCDFFEFNRFIHGNLPYNVLQKDHALRNLLLGMPQRKIVFTNGDKIHAHTVLDKLGVKDCFEQIICFDNLNLQDNFNNATPIVCKPSTKAFHRALQLAGVDAEKALFLDDSPHNIEAAKAIGLWTCLVGKSKKTKGADFAIETIHNLKGVISNK